MNTVLNVLDAVVNTIWQAILITAAIWLFLHIARRINAATRHAIWWTTLAVILVLPVAPRLIPHSPPAAMNSPAQTLAPAPAPSAALDDTVILHVAPQPESLWPRLLLALWASIFFWRIALILRSYFYLRGVKRRALTSQLPAPSIRRPAAVLISNEIASPMAVGFLHPAIILPASIMDRLSGQNVEHVLLHESAHLAGYDDWANLAMRLLGGVLALHPVAIFILHQIDREREIACDDWVVAKTGAARPYAESLAHLLELRQAGRGPVLASGFFGSGSRIGDRIESLLRRSTFSARPSTSRILASSIALLLLTLGSSMAPRWIALAQSPLPSFEVASIKPGSPDSRRFGYGIRGRQFLADNVPVKVLIGFAYEVQYFQIVGGPKWADIDRYSVEAKPDASAHFGLENMHELSVMMQSLLHDRFKLATHQETRPDKVYELVVAKGGPRLKQSAGPDADGRQGIFGRGAGEMVVTDQPIAALAGSLSQRLGRTVIDKTGLTGRYDFTLSFAAEPSPADLLLFGPPSPEMKAATSGLPSVFSALQEQIGLKLESATGPVHYVVIDHVEKPDEN